MSPIKGTWKNGRVLLDEPADWPDGCRVLIEPMQADETIGIQEEDWPDTPEGIAKLLARMEEAEPPFLTPDEEARWKAWRQKAKECQLASMDRYIKEIEGLFR